MDSRAVEKQINAGQRYECAREDCTDKAVKFQARRRLRAIICNVYIEGRWDRVEVFHPSCYAAAGQPYGPVDRSNATILTVSAPRGT